MIDVRPSHDLRLKIELVLPELQAAGAALDSHPRLAELYPEYLFALHCMIRATVPVMQAALDRARALAAGDPVAAGVAAYLGDHVGEEMNHDDELLEDLEVLGVARTDVLRRPPSATIASLVGAQYYWIHHYHPVVLLGHIAVMEGYPPSNERVERLIAKTGYPRAAFRSLFTHADLDEGHREELDAVLDRLPLSPEQWTAVGVNALHTVHQAAAALREVVEWGAPGRRD